MIQTIRFWKQRYDLHRAFGWGRWISFWRAFSNGPHLLYPPDKNPYTKKPGDFEQYIPPGHHIVEDGDGQRFVPNE